MSDDRDVLRAVWDGRVPACFTLSSYEVETLTAPAPYYLLLPRQSYLTLCTDKVRKHFAPSVASALQDKPVWFEFNGAPIKWHLPVGVIFDLVVAADPQLSPPWNITVHFDKYPDKKILKCDSRYVKPPASLN